MPTTIKGVPIYMLRTIWVLICEQMLHHRNVFFPRHTYTPGLVIPRESLPYVGFPKQLICYYRALWIAVLNYGKYMVTDVAYVRLMVIGKRLKILPGIIKEQSFYRPPMIVILSCGMQRRVKLYPDLLLAKCLSVLNFIQTIINNICLWPVHRIRKLYV